MTAMKCLPAYDGFMLPCALETDNVPLPVPGVDEPNAS